MRRMGRLKLPASSDKLQVTRCGDEIAVRLEQLIVISARWPGRRRKQSSGAKAFYAARHFVRSQNRILYFSVETCRKGAIDAPADPYRLSHTSSSAMPGHTHRAQICRNVLAAVVLHCPRKMTR